MLESDFRMANLSFLDDCHDCLERGHKSWESYFSKWDFLAKNEEVIEESGLINDLSEKTEQKNIQKKKIKKNGKIKKIPLNSKKQPSKLLLRNKKILQKKRVTKLRRSKRKPQKKKTQKVQKLTQKSNSGETNENLQDDPDNRQLELDLRTVFLDILKGNKTKWEIFGVLSQTSSRGEITIKTVHDFQFSPVLRNNGDIGRSLSLTSRELIPSNVPVLDNRMISFHTRSLDVKKHCVQRSFRMIENGNQSFNNLRQVRQPVLRCLGNGFLNQSFPLSSFKAFDYRFRPEFSPITPLYPTPKLNFNMLNRFSKGNDNFKNLTHSYLNNSQNENEKRLKLLPSDLSGPSEGGEGSKININKLSSLKARFSNVPEMNIRVEKTFQNLCLHKRTNDVSLNMGNSNFLTPKRKPSERKCFSENILQRKKRCPSKLSFFDYVQDDDSDSDDQSENRSPIIRWESKKRKMEIEAKSKEDSDSDDLELIFERVHRPLSSK